MTICDAISGPTMVPNSLLDFSSFGTIFLGKQELLINVLVDPESNKTLNNFLLLKLPIVLTVQIETGVSFIGNFWPPIIK